MTDHIYTDAITNAILGGDADASLTNWAHEKVTAIMPRITDYRNQRDGLEPQEDDYEAQPDVIVDTAEAELSAASDYAASQLQLASQQADHARRFQNATMMRHNIDRPVHQPEIAQNCFFLAFLMVVEGVTTALFFSSGGLVAGIGEALGLGLIISGTNVLVAALIGGGFFGRYWNYGVNARHPDAVMRSKRLSGRIGSVITALCLAGLLITSGIVRATGETEHLSFTLDTLGTAASDFHSLMLWVVSTAFAILAWRKGLIAFSDPYPGLSHASKAVSLADASYRQASENALHDVDAIYNDVVAAIDDLSNQIAEEREDWVEAVHDAKHQREALLGDLATIESGFSAFAAEKLALHKMVTGRSYSKTSSEPDAPDVRLDLTYLRELLPAVTATRMDSSKAFSEARAAALNRLSAARKSALEAVMSAQALPPD